MESSKTDEDVNSKEVWWDLVCFIGWCCIYIDRSLLLSKLQVQLHTITPKYSHRPVLRESTSSTGFALNSLSETHVHRIIEKDRMRNGYTILL